MNDPNDEDVSISYHHDPSEEDVSLYQASLSDSGILCIACINL